MINSHMLGVLKQLERGEINADQANVRLNAAPVVKDALASKPDLPNWVYWLRICPLAIGMLIALSGVWIIVLTIHANILWFVLGIPIVLLGALVLTVGLLFYSAHWLYVSVEQPRGRHRTIRFAIPFPFSLIRFGLWIAQFVNQQAHADIHVITAGKRKMGIWDDSEKMLAALERELEEGRGISIDIDDKGQRVQLYWLEPKAFQSTERHQGPSAGSKPTPADKFQYAPSEQADDAWFNEWAGY